MKRNVSRIDVEIKQRICYDDTRGYIYFQKKKRKKNSNGPFQAENSFVSRCMEFLVNGKKNERQRLLSNFWHVVNH